MNNTEKKNTRTPKKVPGTTYIMLILMTVATLSLVAASAVIFLPKLIATSAYDTTAIPAVTDTDAIGTETFTEETTVPEEIAVLPPQSEDAEVRGIYIATVQNINFPSKKDLSATELKAELDDIVSTCVEAGLNAVYFQVRPSADALYKSDIFPVSEYLTGSQGSDLPDGFDPLGYLIEAAHARNIKVHAWVNPLRVTVGSASKPAHDTEALAEGHPARENPDYTVAYADGKLYFDCGIPEVRELIASGVAELAGSYAIDGIIFDDYFYPYPVNGADGKLAAFDDTKTFAKYANGMTLDDWRRDNVNKMIEDCYNSIKSVNSDCEFGVAPFGIWQNDDGTNGGSDTKGLESYSAIYCDPTAWIEGGYIDYIAPQIYWRFTTSVARYDTLVRWWNTLLDGTDVKLLVSHGIYNYDTWENPENELRCQVEFARSELMYRGSILYGYAALKNNTKGLFDEVVDVFSEEVIHTDAVSNGKELYISIPYSGSYIDGENTFVIGTSDPTEPLYVDGKPVGRTKSGYFSVYLPLKKGKNTFTFTHKGTETQYVIHRTSTSTSSGEITYATLNSPEIASVTPSYDWMGNGTLPVTVTAPKGASVTATLAGQTIKLTPTLYAPSQSGKYMKEVYSGTFTLWGSTGKIEDYGKIKFTSVYGGKTYTAESANIRVRGNGAYIPIEVLGDDTELKIQPDSWYYDDYTPQSAGMHDNAVQLSSGLYKLRCGGYIAADKVKELDGGAISIATVESAIVSSDAAATYFKFKISENVPINCNLADNEFCVTLYNIDTSKAPKAEFSENPLFESVRSEKSTKVNSYKYYFKLYDIENFYGFRHYYEDGYLIFEWKNPETLPEGDKPLEGKVIILDAGHGGKNPGALGPLGALEGAMNESDFNLEIVLAAQPYLEALGAEVIQIRDRETQIDVPIADRMQTLMDIDPDIMISIHQNSMPYTTDITKIRGVVGLYWSDSGYMLTDVMGETISNALNKLDRSPTKQRLAMVRNAKFPSTLIETCFITSVEEYERMMKPDTVDKIARSIADGVLAYYAAQEKYIK